MKFLSLCFIIISSLFISIMYSYELTEVDYERLDSVEEQLIDFSETRSYLDLDDIILFLEHLYETKEMNEKHMTLMEILIEDMYWYAGYTLTADDCYDDEYFDEEDERCYLIEDNNGATDEETDWGYDEHYGLGGHTTIDEEEIIARYDPTDGFIHLSGEYDSYHENVWKEFSGLFPERYTNFINEVQFFDDTESDTAAYVERSDDSGKHRLVTFNLDALETGENAELFIHEMGHIITLERSQLSSVTPTNASDETMERDQKTCTTHYEFEGCTAPHSYFYKFVGTFWSEEMITITDEEGDVYSGHEENFVSDYAATNPGEDLAETFAYFVTKPKEHGISGEAGEKINFLYTHKELVGLRTYIRERLK